VAVDFEAEGLLEGVDDPDARRARRDLLERLAADGVPLEELRCAVAEDRLAMLPVERVLEPRGERLTANDVAEAAGVDVELLDRIWRALGLALPDRDAPSYTEEDLDAARSVKMFLDAGIAPESVLEMTRVLGTSMSTIVDAVGDLVRETLMQPGDTELDVALNMSYAARELAPQLDDMLAYVANLYRRDRTRQAVIGAAELAAGGLPGGRFTVVGFADLVGFTRLGEEVPADELGAVAGRLAELAAEVVEPPVSLIKTIGDAVMLVAPEADPMLDSTLTLLERAEAEGRDFPQLRAGLAAGEALRRAGDWYGRAVNLASRVTGRARSGSVLVTADVKEAARGEYAWSPAGLKRLRGVSGDVALWRVRRAAA
jgi:adenylate cyclase